METKNIFSVQEAALFLKYSPNYIYKLLTLGKLSHFKPTGLRGRVYFRREDLENYIFRNRRAADYERPTK